MQDLDHRYPQLSQLLRAELGMTLEQLATRAPAGDYEFFNLERLLAHVLDNERHCLHVGVLAPFAAQVRGYLATLDAYLALGIVKNRRRFLVKKLMVPAKPRPTPVSSEMLDTVAECSWALWLHDKHGSVEEEKALLGGIGDADFFVSTTNGALWVDCISVAPPTDQLDLNNYFSRVAIRKWKTKFGARPGAVACPAAIAVTLLKNQENALARLRFDQAVGTSLAPLSQVWNDCPSLQTVWFGLPPFSDAAHRPEVFGTWTRP